MTDNVKSPITKKNIKIVVDEDHGIKEFGSDLFENLITHFVETDYEEKKRDLEDSIKDKDIIKLKSVLHKIKTLTMYMNCVDLAQLCKDIEFYTQQGHENHETALGMTPKFLYYFSQLYDEAYRLFRAKYSQIPEEEKPNKEQPAIEDKAPVEKDPYVITEESIKSENSNTSRDNKRHLSVAEIQEEVTNKPEQNLKNNANDSNKASHQVSNQNFINIESGSLGKQFTFGNSFVKADNNIFRIENSPSIDKKDIDNEFKEKLKMFVEIEAPKISQSISDAIESDNKDELIDTLKKLKSTAAICYFNHLVNEIEEWCKIINTKSSIKYIMKYLDAFYLILEKMTDEAMAVINGKLSGSNKNYVFSVNHPRMPTAGKDVVTSPGNKKVAQNQNAIGTNQPTSLSNYLISKGNDEDNILNELKPLKFDGLFKKNMSEDEIAEEIKKISESTIKEQNLSQNKSRISKQSIKPVSDNSYPFKQESFQIKCLII